MLKGKKNSFFNRAITRFFSFLLLWLFMPSCIDDNYSDIVIDDSVNWIPDISVAVGEGNVELNSYFNNYSFPDSILGDTVSVYYEDSLYYLTDKRIKDTFHLNFSMDQFIEERDNIQYLSMRLTIQNGHPTKTESQIYLYNGPQLLDSLFSEKLVIEPGEVDEEQEVSRPTYQQRDVSLDSSQINNLYIADHAVFYGAVYVTNESLEKIKFYEDYKVNAQIGLQAKFKVHPSDFAQ